MNNTIIVKQIENEYSNYLENEKIDIKNDKESKLIISRILNSYNKIYKNNIDINNINIYVQKYLNNYFKFISKLSEEQKQYHYSNTLLSLLMN